MNTLHQIALVRNEDDILFFATEADFLHRAADILIEQRTTAGVTPDKGLAPEWHNEPGYLESTRPWAY